MSTETNTDNVLSIDRAETPLRRLARMTIEGMKAWAHDEDGVHEGAWDAYVEAHTVLGLPAPDPEGCSDPNAAVTRNDAIYAFRRWCGRAGDLAGVFCAKPSEVEAIIGREVRFGEVLGKHSNVKCVIEAKDVRLVTSDPKFVGMFKRFSLSTGINPVSYARVNDEEDAALNE